MTSDYDGWGWHLEMGGFLVGNWKGSPGTTHSVSYTVSAVVHMLKDTLKDPIKSNRDSIMLGLYTQMFSTWSLAVSCKASPSSALRDYVSRHSIFHFGRSSQIPTFVSNNCLQRCLIYHLSYPGQSINTQTSTVHSSSDE